MLHNEHQHEYQSVILAGLLHDIGKFFHKAATVQMKHPEASLIFVQSKSFPEKFRDEILKTLVQKHHESSYMPEDLQIKSISDNHIRNLALLHSLADNYSSSERAKEKSQEYTDYKTTSLHSIFNNVDIGLSSSKTFYSYLPLKYYPNENDIFPKLAQDNPTEKISKIINDFGQEFENSCLNSDMSFHCLYVTFYYLLLKYTWCIPSDTTKEIRDISLFDHLKTTSAIAGCMYIYHSENNSLDDEKTIRNENLNKFMLIAGDFSGIQKYIFDIASNEAGGVAKRLRARSFLISLLSEAVSMRLIKNLNLEISNIIISSGGNFYILAPNTISTEQKLNNEINKISQYLYERYHGELILNIATQKFSAGCFEDFSEVLEKVKEQITKIKKQPFKNILIENEKWKVEKFLFKRDADYKPCQICKRFPGKNTSNSYESAICENCRLDETIGRKLVKKNFKYLSYCFSDTEANTCENDSNRADIEFFNDEKLRIIFHERLNDIDDSFITLAVNPYDKEQTEKETILPIGFKFFANHIPLFNTSTEAEQICYKNCSLGNKDVCDYRREVLENKNLYPLPQSFQCIASQDEGANYLSFIKGDVDRLGILFSFGLEASNETAGVNLSISRISTLSRMLDMFFSGYIQHLLHKPEFKNTYTVYSGGDDFFLITKWNKAIELAQKIKTDFEKYTCENKNFSISFGIATVKPSIPVAAAAEESEIALKNSKAKGRSRLTVFEQDIPFDDLTDVLVFQKKLEPYISKSDADDKKAIIKPSFLYRLLHYANLNKQFRETGNTENLIYMSHLSYDLMRNIYRKNDKERESICEFLYGKLIGTGGGAIKDEIWEYLPVIITNLALNRR